MPRFVVLFHEVPAGQPRASHYDLMLEQEGALWTWALEQLPVPGQSVPAEKLADHRIAYLDYEGEVSKHRGTVQRVDAGEFELLEQSATSVRAALRGARLRGILTLNQQAKDSSQWSAALTSV